MAGVGWRATVGAVVGAGFGALDAGTAADRVFRAAWFASLGLTIAVTLPSQVARLRSLDRRDRRTARRCVRAGLAPDDPRLEPAVVAAASAFLEPVPLERSIFWLFATWVGVLGVVVALNAADGDVAEVVWAGIWMAFAALMCWGVRYRRHVLRPRATASYNATIELMARPNP